MTAFVPFCDEVPRSAIDILVAPVKDDLWLGLPSFGGVEDIGFGVPTVPPPIMGNGDLLVPPLYPTVAVDGPYQRPGLSVKGGVELQHLVPIGYLDLGVSTIQGLGVDQGSG